MTDLTPSKGIDDGLPAIEHVAENARLLHGLIEAIDGLAELLGPKSDPVYAIVQAALPLARDLRRDLDRIRG